LEATTRIREKGVSRSLEDDGLTGRCFGALSFSNSLALPNCPSLSGLHPSDPPDIPWYWMEICCLGLQGHQERKFVFGEPQISVRFCYLPWPLKQARPAGSAGASILCLPHISYISSLALPSQSPLPHALTLHSFSSILTPFGLDTRLQLPLATPDHRSKCRACSGAQRASSTTARKKTPPPPHSPHCLIRTTRHRQRSSHS